MHGKKAAGKPASAPVAPPRSLAFASWDGSDAHAIGDRAAVIPARDALAWQVVLERASDVDLPLEKGDLVAPQPE
jgi:hypothetical protein